MRRFAEGTKVPIETTRAELERLLRAYGADAVVMGWDGPVSTIAWTAFLRAACAKRVVENKVSSMSNRTALKPMAGA